MFDATRSTALRALSLGVAGGFRSWPPLASVTLTWDQAPARHGWRRWPVLPHPWTRRVLAGLAVAEFIADKLPDTQARIAPTLQLSHVDTGLVGRVGAAALAGAALGSEQRATAVGAAFAGLGALVGNFGGYSARKAAVEVTGVPDPVIALVEDVAALVLLAAAVQDR